MGKFQFLYLKKQTVQNSGQNTGTTFLEGFEGHMQNLLNLS